MKPASHGTIIADLGSKAKILSDKIEVVRRDFSDVQSESKDIQRIRQTFNETLSATWVPLAQKLTDIDGLKTLDRVLDDMDVFLSELHRIVLSPRRTRLENQLSNWLGAWLEQSIPWNEFLRETTDEQLNTLEVLIQELEAAKLNHQTIENIWIYWIKYQVSELEDKEKHFENLLTWLTHVRQTRNEALELDQFLETIENEGYDNPVLRKVKQKWLQDRLTELSEVTPRQPNLDLSSKRDDYESNWSNLSSILILLKTNMQDLSDSETELINRAVNDWSRVSADLVQSLVHKLAEAAKCRRTIQETPQLSLANQSLLEPPMKSVENLLKSRPQLPEPSQVESFDEYLERLKGEHSGLSEWLNQFEKVADQLEQQTYWWTDQASKFHLQDELDFFSTAFSHPSSLSDIVQTHNRMVKAQEEVRRLLRKELSDEENTVFNTILQYSDGERISLSQVVDALKSETNDYLGALVSLSEKNLIQLEIVLE